MKNVMGPDPTEEREQLYSYLEELAADREENARGRGLSGIVRQMNYVETHFLSAVAEKYPSLVKKVLGRIRWKELKEEQEKRMASTTHIAQELVTLAKALSSSAGSSSRTAKAKKIIKVNWNDEKSIKDAEKQKAKLEDDGFELIKTVGGVTTTELYYEKVASAKSVHAANDEKFIADQLVNSWEFMSEREMVKHLAKSTKYTEDQLKPFVDKWYDDISLRMKMDLARTNQWVRLLKSELKTASSRTALRGLRREFYRPSPEFSEQIEEIKVPKDVDLEIWSYVQRGDLYGIAFQGKSQKPLWTYRFRNKNQLMQKVDDTIEARRKTLEYKKERQRERQEFRHEYEVGDFLYASWGYDQTNIDFFQVIGTTDKSVVIREVANKIVRSKPPQDYVVPVKNKFVGKKMTKRVGPGGYVKIDSVSSASKWDGKPKYQTSSGWGH